MNCERCLEAQANPKLTVCDPCFAIIIKAEQERCDTSWKSK